MRFEQVHDGTELDLLHETLGRISASESLHQALSEGTDFAKALLKSDSCSIYVQHGDELVLCAGGKSNHETHEQPNCLAMEEVARLLAKYRVPIALHSNGLENPHCRLFNAWSEDPGETFVSTPLFYRGKLMGLMNVRHCRPHVYGAQEISALSTVGFLLGATIGISHLERENTDLVLQLETRHLVERGKGILQREFGLTEEQAFLALQRQSRQMRRSMKELAEAIILGHEMKQTSLVNAAAVE